MECSFSSENKLKDFTDRNGKAQAIVCDGVLTAKEMKSFCIQTKVKWFLAFPQGRASGEAYCYKREKIEEGHLLSKTGAPNRAGRQDLKNVPCKGPCWLGCWDILSPPPKHTPSRETLSPAKWVQIVWSGLPGCRFPSWGAKGVILMFRASCFTDVMEELGLNNAKLLVHWWQLLSFFNYRL